MASRRSGLTATASFLPHQLLEPPHRFYLFAVKLDPVLADPFDNVESRLLHFLQCRRLLSNAVIVGENSGAELLNLAQQKNGLQIRGMVYHQGTSQYRGRWGGEEEGKSDREGEG